MTHVDGKKTKMDTVKMQKQCQKQLQSKVAEENRAENKIKCNSHHVGRYRKTHAGCKLGGLSL